MAELIVDIERMCYGGAGVGRVEGKALFVPFTAPKDRAKVRVVREKKRYLEAELVETLADSPFRCEPRCPVFGLCGGCNWQHLIYEEQLRQKGEIFASTLTRLGGVEGADILPVLGAPEEYGYRYRIQLKVGAGARPLLGFFRGGTHEVIDIPGGCPIAHPVLNVAMAEFREFLKRFPEPSPITQIDLSLGHGDEIIAVCHCREGAAAALQGESVRIGRELPSVGGLYISEGSRGRLLKVYGLERLSYLVPAGTLPGGREMRLSFSRGGFSQVNQPQNLNLIRAVFDAGGFTERDRVLDLYCGNGNLSLPLAPLVKSVVGVEGYAPSVADARQNARENDVENAQFLSEETAPVLNRMVRSGERFDVTILDPPRSGAQAISLVAELAPRRVVYVSCDPPTLARDLSALQEKGYRVERALPIDMFPQTYHLESVTLLTRT